MSPFTSACIDDHFSGVDQVHDQPPQRGRVLDFGPGLLEDFAEHPRLLAEFFEDVPVVGFEFVAFPLQQALPSRTWPGRWAGGCTAAWSARRPS